MLTILRGGLTLVFSALVFTSISAQNSFWQDVPASEFTNTPSQKRLIRPVEARTMKLNTAAMLAALQTAPMEFTAAASANPLIISLPDAEGRFLRYAIVQSVMMEPELQAKFPNIRTYSGYGIDQPGATVKLDWTEFGFHAQVREAGTNNPLFIDPYADGETTQYNVYRKSDLPAKQQLEVGVLEQEIQSLSGLAQKTNAGVCLGAQLKTYRLAVACTGEYAAAVGGTTVALALSKITTTVNRVNGIFETELSIRLTLIGNNNLIVYTDATTDPFTGNNNSNILINESQTVIDANIGNGAYDIGHTFSTGAGGLAQSPAVCWTGSKARGVTGSANPTGDAYDVDFVAHEMGHQFGGSHSFNAVSGGCGGGNRNGSTSVEPGSGITIMGYAGLCNDASNTNNLANNSIPYFHAISQNQIGTYVISGNGNTCGTATNTGNVIPTVNAGADYTIPVSTPFTLSGSATDANTSEVLTYSWEEIDNGVAGNWNSGNKPFFRSFAPTLSSSRTFPKMSDILTNTQTIGEFLPTTAQALNFRLTARDNRPGGSGICSDDMSVTVDATAGPFTVTSQSTATSLTANGTNTMNITWNVASTNIAPVNATNVSILFSADGGIRFPYTLVASTANDGSETIVVPSIKTSNGRIMVKPVGNIFFNVNTGTITISTSCAAEGASVTPNTTVTAQYGNAALNLGLAPQYATPFAPSGQITTSDPATNLTAMTNGTCTNYSNKFNYDQHTFTPSVTGTYTIQRTGSGSVFNIYQTTFTPGSGCTNLVVSNFETSLGTSASVNVSLTAGTTYVLVIGMYGPDAATSSASLPFNYSFAVTATPPGGALYSGAALYADPGAGFSYTYVIVNNATGNIVSIGPSDLSNGSNYPPGQYTVYGLSYSNTISNLNSYVGGSLTALLTQIQNNPATFCANLSKNSVTVNVTGTFPVQFTSLRARKQGEIVALDWGTLTEQNNSHFVVERSANGANFKELGTVKAAGFSNSLKTYYFNDITPLPDWNYYRIRQVDFDSKFSYSNIAAVNFEKDGSLIVIYPNPARDVLNIEYTSMAAGKLQLQVIDSKGSVVVKKDMTVTAGKNLESINVSTLSQGMYILRYQDNAGNVSYSRFVKQ
ncbi:MAG TPA: zinc-dependent metalloprotease family protein [Chitinophagaceae bacterium]